MAGKAARLSDALTAIGLMSGTSLDGIDAAILRTDGDTLVEPGPVGHWPYGRELRISIRRAIKAALEGRDHALDIGKAANEITRAHAAVIAALLERERLQPAEIDIIGFHGQTILHRPGRQPGSAGRTWQIGDGRALAVETGIDVVADFRSADVAAGGEGAPLAPIYHCALVGALNPPRAHAVAIVNLGGVANITYAPPGARGSDLIAFDCGPGNGLLDEWAELKTGAPMDKDGALSLAGAVDDEALRMMVLAPYLRRKPPKSLDRYDFKLDRVSRLSPEDGAATLAAFTAACIHKSQAFFPEPVGEWIICGGGRRNPALLEAMRRRLEAPVKTAEEVGWRGDALEAECFAYLAARSVKNLAFSFPMTTRAPVPMGGGVLHRARA